MLCPARFVILRGRIELRLTINDYATPATDERSSEPLVDPPPIGIAQPRSLVEHEKLQTLQAR